MAHRHTSLIAFDLVRKALLCSRICFNVSIQTMKCHEISITADEVNHALVIGSVQM